jgi:hypothetical protein
MIELLTWMVLPVLAVHIGLDLFDKHWHGIRLHDKVSILAYAVLAVHFGLDIMEAVR